ncbi:BZ3500_MvSof-1268-A1-R1_Chr6-1g08360 [Microbotryum saponariae]|uniref:BZ3500_MvSof-1268-A1-R1_Chr6-1g08360 protein n=1 Tax=Microbotryum saponariae TaxID=289078 RepID=A0A2X0LKL0_9BASI|nr:BZ3500_MvSof-1268-A1-R1_Chr6-1g08360 [Microbotryum saponariae]SDA07644.1 BZ3501_MvSof-1269-A2-R1_Chr6-1g08081 [Microbotryum saponariae]
MYIARNSGEVPRSQAPDLAVSKGLKQEPDGTSSLKRPTEATQDSDLARPTKKVAIVPAKKVPTIPRSQTKQASGAVITTESTNGAVATTLPTGSVFDASESCPRAAAAPGVTVSNKVSAVAATSFKKASTSPLPVVASGSTSAKVTAAGARAQVVAQGTPPKPTIKCLLPSTADQNRSKPPAVELPVRRPTVRFARTEVFSTADGRSTTVSAKGDFLGVWVPKH